MSEKFHICDTSLQYGILGLHTCGDLGRILDLIVGCFTINDMVMFKLTTEIKVVKSNQKRTNKNINFHQIKIVTAQCTLLFKNLTNSSQFR